MRPNLTCKGPCARNMLIISFAVLYTLTSCLEIQTGTTSPDLSSPIGKIIEIPLEGRFTDDGRFYYLNASVGTEGQWLELMIDTGSTDTWVYGRSYCNGGFGNDTWQCYNESASSTSKPISYPPFLNATYGKEKVSGVYMEDTFRISTASVTAFRFGVIDQGSFTAGGGILGLGFDTAEFGPNDTFGYLYPDLLDTMFNECVIASRSFGLSIRNSVIPRVPTTGSLMLGGFDTSKMEGPPAEFDIVSPKKVARLGAPLSSISATVKGESTEIWKAISDGTIKSAYIPAVLDSGDSRTQIPILAHAALKTHLKKSFGNDLFEKWQKDTPWLGDMDCKHRFLDATVDFTFADTDKSITIKVPFSELVLPWESGCRFALRPKPQYNEAHKKPTWVNFGSSILGSLYMAVNYDTNTLQIAKAQHPAHDMANSGGRLKFQEKSEL